MATKRNKRTEKYKIISLRKLSTESGIDYEKLYNNLSGRYKGMNANEKTRLCNTLYEELIDLFKFLGFDIIITRSVEEQIADERAAPARMLK